tara:strand:- start:4 stop:990 length:987 start_codon:yes stop_codon:yes gene_type:complete
MGYLDDYDKRVFKDCKTKAIYKNNIMNNLANGRVISSNTGKGFVVQKPTSKEDIAKTLQKYNLPMKDVFESINVDEFVNEINANGQDIGAIVLYGLQGIDNDDDDGSNDGSVTDGRNTPFELPALYQLTTPVQQSTSLTPFQLPTVDVDDLDVAVDNDDVVTNPRTPREPASSPGFPFINTRPATQSRSESVGIGTRSTPSVSQTLNFGSPSSSQRGGLVAGNVVATVPPKSSRKSPVSQVSQVIGSIQRTAQKIHLHSQFNLMVEGDSEEEEEEQEEVNLIRVVPTDEELINYYGEFPKREISQMLIGNRESSDVVERVNALFGIRE